MSVSGMRPVEDREQSAVNEERLAGALEVDRATATAIANASASRVFMSAQKGTWGPLSHCKDRNRSSSRPASCR